MKIQVDKLNSHGVFFRKNFESYTSYTSYTVVVHGSMKSCFQLTCLFSQIFCSSHLVIDQFLSRFSFS